MSDYSRFRTLEVCIEDSVAMVSLNRPDALNAINHSMHLEIEEILGLVADDRQTNAIIITGKGKAFSAGGDIKAMKARIDNPQAQRDYVQNFVLEGPRKLIHNFLEVPQPIIAAVNGDALGLGATIALFSDIIIMSENARIGDPHVRVGIVAGDGGPAIWPLLTSLCKAKELLLTGDLLNAREAERLGLVNRVVPSEEVLPTALELARRLASGPSFALRWTKAALNKRLRDEVNLVLDSALAAEGLSFLSGDHQEAVEAFLEKRKPDFRPR